MTGQPITPASVPTLLPGQTQSNQTVKVVGVSAGQVLPNNPRRKSLLLVNTSSNNIYVGLAPDVGISNGILLVANGGFFSSADWEDFDLTRSAFYAIATAADSPLLVLDVEIVGN